VEQLWYEKEEKFANLTETQSAPGLLPVLKVELRLENWRSIEHQRNFPLHSKSVPDVQKSIP